VIVGVVGLPEEVEGEHLVGDAPQPPHVRRHLFGRS
jgi:hypothetical protein